MYTTYPYRGFCRKLNKWVSGFLYDATPMYCFREDYETQGRNLFILVPGFADWGMPRPVEKYPVLAESVGMYTGVTLQLHGKEYPIYTGMLLDARDANGRRKKLTVSGPVNGCFVCGDEEYPQAPLSELLEIYMVSDPEII